MRKFLIALAVLFAAACNRTAPDVTRSGDGARSPASAAQPGSNTATMNPAVPSAFESPASSHPTAPATQEIHLLEYQINMPDSLPAGQLSLHVENAGKEDHGLVIEGNGIQQKTAELKRGDTAQLDVNLKPGTYTVYCPVDGHRGKGMERTITVK